MKDREAHLISGSLIPASGSHDPETPAGACSTSRIYVEFTDAPGIKHLVTGALFVVVLNNPAYIARARRNLVAEACVTIKQSKAWYHLNGDELVTLRGYKIDSAVKGESHD